MIIKIMEATLPDGRLLKWTAHFPTEWAELLDTLETWVVKVVWRNIGAIDKRISEAMKRILDFPEDPAQTEFEMLEDFNKTVSELWERHPEDNPFTRCLRDSVVFNLVGIEKESGAKIVKDGDNPLPVLTRYLGWLRAGKPGGLAAFVAIVEGTPMVRAEVSGPTEKETWLWPDVCLRFDHDLESAIVLHKGRQTGCILSKDVLKVKPSAWERLQAIVENDGELTKQRKDKTLTQTDRNALGAVNNALARVIPECTGKAILEGKARFQIERARDIEINRLKGESRMDEWMAKRNIRDLDPGIKAETKKVRRKHQWFSNPRENQEDADD